MERVSLIQGSVPVIIVAPHGFDQNDFNTALIAEQIANRTKCFAIINRGFERSNQVDCFLDKADCNDINHIHEDVVKEEFLDPIIRYKTRLLKYYDEVFIYHIHGMSDRHKTIVGDPSLGIVLGYGAGKPDSFTCQNWHKDFTLSYLNDNGITSYQGSKGGPMSGWARSNLNQLFRKKYLDERVNSMQLEITYSLRNTDDVAKKTADVISSAVLKMGFYTSFTTNLTFKSY